MHKLVSCVPLTAALAACHGAEPPPKPPVPYGLPPSAEAAREAVVMLDAGNGSHGTGMVISRDGYVVTMRHVAVEPGMQVVWHGKNYAMTRIAEDESLDIAVVRAPAPFTTPIRLGSLYGLPAGTPVYAYGYPQYVGLAMARGWLLLEDFTHGPPDKPWDHRTKLTLDMKPGGSGACVLLEENGVCVGFWGGVSVTFERANEPRKPPIPLITSEMTPADDVREFLSLHHIPYVDQDGNERK